MSFLLLSALLWLWDNRSLDKISRNNLARIEGWEAYEAGDYRRAVEQYRLLVGTSLFVDPSACLNLAHSYFSRHQYQEAQLYYAQVSHSSQSQLSAVARVQLGVISCIHGDSASALTYFHQALEASPTNEEAQFNYELIKKTFSGKVTPPAHTWPQTTHRPNSTTAEIKKQDPEENHLQVEKNNKKHNLLRRLHSLNLSEKQVLNLLNSMQENEVLYIHQRKTPPTDVREDYKNW